MIEVSRLLVSEKLENKDLRHRRREGSAPVVVWCTTRKVQSKLYALLFRW